MSAFSYQYPRPALTVDVVVLRGRRHAPEVLLVRRAVPPFAGYWALPGGFVNEEEPLLDAARRELAEETALAPVEPFVEFGAYGDPKRDPRGWTVSIAYLVRLMGDGGDVRGADDAEKAAWHLVSALPRLAFDHERILRDALERATSA